jgi:hypothetical protein
MVSSYILRARQELPRINLEYVKRRGHGRFNNGCTWQNNVGGSREVGVDVNLKIRACGPFKYL